MKTTQLISAIALVIIFSTGCNKETTEVEPTNTSTQNGSNTSTPTGTSSISYTVLSAAQSTIAIGATTTVTATATGDGLTFSWSASDGDIIGSGSQVTYGASGCCGGNNTITCTVKDANNNQESKSISILVQ